MKGGPKPVCRAELLPLLPSGSASAGKDVFQHDFVAAHGMRSSIQPFLPFLPRRTPLRFAVELLDHQGLAKTNRCSTLSL